MSAPAPWRRPPGLLAGHAYGLASPSALFDLAPLPDDAGAYARLTRTLGDRLPHARAPFEALDAAAGAPAALVALVHAVQRACGLPELGRGRVLWTGPAGATVVLPACAHSLDGLPALVAALVTAWRGPPSDDGALDAALARLREAARRAPNTTELIGAAIALGMPVLELPGGLVQYGLGRRSAWLDSSLTQATSHIAATAARDKMQTAALLHAAGVPVPEHRRVGDADEAVAAARALGGAVVVKPADLDGGLGVAAGLTRPEQVAAAFAAARGLSARILVERHVEGRDYRLTVIDGRTAWAIERRPAGVTGDGRLDVRGLVAALNADPRRGRGPGDALKPVDLDEEALELLRDAGLSPADVPAAGRFVRLRRAANVASGGMPVAVNGQVHPDNARLAERAAAALRLDVAGVDLLCPDIARSWREGGACVCEVNAQPFLGRVTARALYPALLRRRVPGDGRVPTVVLAGRLPAGLGGAVAAALRAAGFATGRVEGGAATLDDEGLHPGPLGPHAAGRVLALDARCAAMVLVLDDADMLRTGLPFARVDVLVLGALPAHEGAAMLAMLLPACDGEVVPLEGGTRVGEDWRAHTPAAWSATVAADALPARIAALASGLDARHARAPDG